MEDKMAWHSATAVTCQTYRLCAPFSKASLQSQRLCTSQLRRLGLVRPA